MQRHPNKEFDVEFLSAGDWADASDPFDVYSTKEFCSVKFKVRRGFQDYTVETFVDRAHVPAEAYIKVAMHQLHLDFLKLAEQTKEWELADEDFPPPPKKPPAAEPSV